MVKMPDFSEISKKINLQSMLDNVKSAIGTASTPGASKVLEGDALVAKFSDIMNLMGNLSDMHAQQAKAIAHVTAKIHELDKDIQAMKIVAANCTPAQTHTSTTTVETIDVVEVDGSSEETKAKAAKKAGKDK